MEYGYKKQSKLNYEETVARTRELLQKEGFGVMTEIDVKSIVKKKLNVDFDNYIILGACNPPFAYQALQAERDIGLMMPCNVIVYDKGGKTYINAIRPTIAMQVTGNEKLRGIAENVEGKLKKVVDGVAGG